MTLVWLIPFLAVVLALALRSFARLVGFALRGALPALARADGTLSTLERMRTARTK